MDKGVNSFFQIIQSWIMQLRYKIKLGTNSIVKKNCKIEGGKFISIGNNSMVGDHSWLGVFTNGIDGKIKPEIKIGNEVRIGRYSCITATNSIQIADGCLISEHFYTSDHSHGFDPAINLSPVKQELFSKGPVSIRENCFIGNRVTILPNVTIGKGCVINSHAVVTKSIPDFTMVEGIPAKVIKKFDFQLKDWIEIKEE